MLSAKEADSVGISWIAKPDLKKMFSMCLLNYHNLVTIFSTRRFSVLWLQTPLLKVRVFHESFYGSFPRVLYHLLVEFHN